MKRAKLVRTATAGAAALGALLGGTGTAGASYPQSGYADGNGIQVMARPLSVNGKVTTVATWCNNRSNGARVDVGILDESNNSYLPMEDTHSGWTTYPTYINFNPGACESFFLYTPSVNGDLLRVYFTYGAYVYVDVGAVVPG